VRQENIFQARRNLELFIWDRPEKEVAQKPRRKKQLDQMEREKNATQIFPEARTNKVISLRRILLFAFAFVTPQKVWRAPNSMGAQNANLRGALGVDGIFV